jgi:hypothetical protein
MRENKRNLKSLPEPLRSRSTRLNHLLDWGESRSRSRHRAGFKCGVVNLRGYRKSEGRSRHRAGNAENENETEEEEERASNAAL